ncbi:hypothetical protein TS65_28585 [Aneurinibacillus migulanus]|nr:hypothetical protein TS65_28585 [Aneurinibacillus migulanus]
MPCAPAEKRRTCLFPTAPAHRPSFFSYLSPQEFVDVSNQMYIDIKGEITKSFKEQFHLIILLNI